jgi:sec-independent protein translocase protein TatC
MSSPEDVRGAAAPGAISASGPASFYDKLRGMFGGGQQPRRPDEDEEEDGMLRMSFLGHLEELRSRLIKMIVGIIVALGISLTFCKPLWNFVQEPAHVALRANHVVPEKLAQTEPMEAFNIIWFKMPVVIAIFLASPWVLFQIWAFISPGLYRREKKWAIPFILTSAGLFILGGLFGYFYVFRYGLTFLLGIGTDNSLTQVITVTKYFDMFVNVILGVGIVFELPVVIFFLILFHIATPGFLLRHSRYAILIIFVIAAIVTPTPDVFNMCLFALPMCLLFYVGIFAGYLLVLKRENRRFPWVKVIGITLAVILLVAGVLYYEAIKHNYRLVPHWPFLIK